MILLRILRDAFIVLIVSTCVAQLTKKTPHAFYYFFFIVIVLALSFNFY